MESRAGLFDFIRKTSFLTFIFAWIISMIIFGIIYFLSSTTGIIISIYNGFLVGIIFGFGSITFQGATLIVSYIQLALSIIIVLILLDKLLQRYVFPQYHVRHAQDKKINTTMLMMSIFRNDIDKAMHELRTKARTTISIREIEALIDGLYVAFLDIEKLFSHKNIHRSKIQDIQYRMLTENIQDSLEKLEKFIAMLDSKNISWKDKSTEFWLRYIINAASKITSHAEHIKNPKIIIALENTKEYVDNIEKKL